MIASDPIATAPALHLAPQDVDTLLDELRVYHAIYRPLVQRREPREWSKPYRHGLRLELPRKSIAPMVLALHGPPQHAGRAMQQFLSEGAWDDTPILCRQWQEVDRDLGDDQGVLLLDGSDFPKQGTKSVGVKRQYCGERGKRANCQAGVVLGDASQHGDPLVDRRLYVPQEWLEDEAYAERRKACGLPEGVAFTTKPMLGWTMLQAVHQAGGLRCRWVACDAAFGRATTLLDPIAGVGLWYYAEVPQDTRGWRARPATAVPGGRAGGVNRPGLEAWVALWSPRPWPSSPPPCRPAHGRRRRLRQAAQAPSWPISPPCG